MMGKDLKSPPDSGSEGENGEKPVRERLKQTSIDKAGQDAAAARREEPQPQLEDQDAGAVASESGKLTENPVSRSTRKRALEGPGKLDATVAVDHPVDDLSSAHTRKRTREIREGDDAADVADNGFSAGKTEEPGDAQESDKQETKASERASTPNAASKAKATGNEISLQSPRKKRSRESLDASEGGRDQKIPSTEETRARRSSSEERSKRTTGSAPPSSAASEQQKDALKNAPIFGEALQPKPLEKKKSDLPQTSPSKFAASGFASLSGTASAFGSTGSAFGTSSSSESSTLKPSLGQPSAASPFASPGKPSSGFGSFGAPTSSFASVGSASAFGGAHRGSTFASGFGGGFGSGAKLSSFAAPVGDANLAAKPTEKAFGASKDDEENESVVTSDTGEEPDGEAAAARQDGEESPTQFKVQDVATGEDNEDSIFVNRSKLYQFHNKENAWKERGVGPFKVNMQHAHDVESAETNGDEESHADEDSTSHTKARFLMRNYATHKVILNTPIFQEMSIKEHGAKQLLFICPNETGEMTTYMLKMSREEDIRHLIKLVRDLQSKM